MIIQGNKTGISGIKEEGSRETLEVTHGTMHVPEKLWIYRILEYCLLIWNDGWEWEVWECEIHFIFFDSTTRRKKFYCLSGILKMQKSEWRNGEIWMTKITLHLCIKWREIDCFEFYLVQKCNLNLQSLKDNQLKSEN